ncbi:MAG: DnaB-like helicase C-terminal domain-containing protein, partial [Luteibaculum sp.]
ESGSIEQDADIVSFIYRPEYYGITEDEDGNPTTGVGEIMIAKHRNGAVENVKLRFKGHLARFENLDDSPLDDDNPYGNMGGGGGMKPNASFDSSGGNQNVIIKGSKINDDTEEPDDDIFGSPGDDNSPF